MDTALVKWLFYALGDWKNETVESTRASAVSQLGQEPNRCVLIARLPTELIFLLLTNGRMKEWCDKVGMGPDIKGADRGEAEGARAPP